MTCAAPSTTCGTPSGWRRGGRCTRCRLAHNQDTNRRRRPWGDEQRSAFLAALRGGETAEAAAGAAGVTPAVVAQAARSDGELRAALDGMPVGVQVAARRAEFMAALVRCGGNERMAELQAGLPRCTASNWRQADPAFAAAVAGVQAWLGAVVGPRPRKARTSLSEEALERLREMWEGKQTIREIAAELGVSTPTVIRWAGRLGLPSKGKRTRA